MIPETALYMIVLEEVPCLEVVHVHKEFEDSVGNVTLIQHVLNLKQSKYDLYSKTPAT